MDAIRTTNVWDEVLDFLVTQPTLQQIGDFHASEVVDERVGYLLDRNRQGILTAEEKAEMEELRRVNHFAIQLRSRTYRKMLNQQIAIE